MPFATQVCDTISELAAELYDEPGWPELVPFVFQCVQSGQEGLMESGLSIFANLAHYMSDAFKPHLATLVQVLAACLAHPTRDVQLAALRAVASFIQVRRATRLCACCMPCMAVGLHAVSSCTHAV